MDVLVSVSEGNSYSLYLRILDSGCQSYVSRRVGSMSLLMIGTPLEIDGIGTDIQKFDGVPQMLSYVIYMSQRIYYILDINKQTKVECGGSKNDPFLSLIL